LFRLSWPSALFTILAGSFGLCFGLNGAAEFAKRSGEFRDLLSIHGAIIPKRLGYCQAESATRKEFATQ
jgi:hypothetical protein